MMIYDAFQNPPLRKMLQSCTEKCRKRSVLGTSVSDTFVSAPKFGYSVSVLVVCVLRHLCQVRFASIPEASGRFPEGFRKLTQTCVTGRFRKVSGRFRKDCVRRFSERDADTNVSPRFSEVCQALLSGRAWPAGHAAGRPVGGLAGLPIDTGRFPEGHRKDKSSRKGRPRQAALWSNGSWAKSMHCGRRAASPTGRPYRMPYQAVRLGGPR